ncbi:MAG TPA: hypothetical protein VM451_02640 [Candidatus Limnocylindria bacterium]|nr:hypothetical protein [Candidatus Limnocylindria bacterium]
MKPIWIAAIAASAGAGIIHLALGPEHVDELGGLGLGFYLAAGLQLGWSIAVAVILTMRGASGAAWLRSLALTGIAINGAIVAAWVISRTVGLPAGEMPWVPEAIGRPDGVSVLLQLALVVGLAAWLRGPLAGAASARLRHPVLASALAVVLIGAGTAFGLTGEGHAHVPSADMGAMHGHDGDASSPETDVRDELHQVDRAGESEAAGDADAVPQADAAETVIDVETPANTDAHAPGDADHTH